MAWCVVGLALGGCDRAEPQPNADRVQPEVGRASEAAPGTQAPHDPEGSRPTGPTVMAAGSEPAAAPTGPRTRPAAPSADSTLPAATRAALLRGPFDEPADVEIHYIQSNETRHDLFFDAIADRGGALLGVGSDPSLTMAAAADAQLVLLVDIDRRVVDVHALYAALVPRAESPAALVAMFAHPQRDATLSLLTDAFAGRPQPERRRLLQEYRGARETLHRHLQRVADRTVDGEPASWLSNPAWFARVQQLYRDGRVLSVVGDLTGPRTLQHLGSALAAHEIDVGTLYFSNAEEYFRYTPQFVANLRALPTAADAVVLRTLYNDRWEHADLWAYQTQPLADLLARIDAGHGRSRRAMLRYAEQHGAVERDTGRRGRSTVGSGPGSSPG